MEQFSVTDIKELGDMICRSGMFNCDTSHQGSIIAWECLQKGMTPFEWRRIYNLVGNNETMRADAMAGLFMQNGGEIANRERTRERASATFIYKGESFDLELTFEQAALQGFTHYYDKKAKKKVIKDNYEKIPDKMLWARLVSDSIRYLAPHLVKGVYTPEEASDFVSEGNNPVQDVAGSKPVKASAELPGGITDTEVVSAPPEGQVLPGINSEFAVCPVGQWKGQRFDSLPLELLKKMHESKNVNITEEHKTEIMAAALKVKRKQEGAS